MLHLFVSFWPARCRGQARAAYDTQSVPDIGQRCPFPVHFAPGRQLQISAIMHPDEVSRLIEAGFENATVSVASDDNTHFEALVIAAEFTDKRSLARHQMVYKTLGQLVGNEIHALSIRAYTPDEWQQRTG